MSDLPDPQEAGRPYRVAMVCLGNICRSPMAEVVTREEVARRGLGDLVAVDSSGTGGWHAGADMDERALAALAGRGLDGASHRARQFVRDWASRYDLVLAMDRDNLRALRSLGVPEERLRLFRSFDPSAPREAEVPDPYYGGRSGFDEVLDMVEAAARGLADDLEKLLRR
ncbi:low molecular weight protein-tyrosine-phosphatase [Bailinhaonella thermotolerans]|uniref:protein-tyrosine-phosphatase n=1 Tax=Bailinhaonella thermotolerans TaxID=1070861 RepID=A0A3A4AEM8_9ACTN|nr:low molecular weight protein-tyrosine-phosphatase [Bailinhaonella thermotolerans]RJL25197.1 low molecular weight phosphotyrosine protein phosphatase [Bailinhaonella thermotolerans]